MAQTGTKRCSCQHYPYSCNTAGNLRIHMMTHAGKKSSKCLQCAYSCTTTTKLRRHMMTHTREKFKCPECHYSCSQAANINKSIDILLIEIIQQNLITFPEMKCHSQLKELLLREQKFVCQKSPFLKNDFQQILSSLTQMQN